ncbi:MAG: hypothetical protein N3D10_03565, partial [Candidatus Micrarchaeota archaeon]|nr:hypothetical protein [Candidatus Micrarchaeota archaeon]
LGGDGEQILNAVTDKEGFSDIHAGKYLSITKYLLDIENSYMLMKLYIGSLKDLLTSMIKEKDNLNITKYIQENPITYAEETYNLEIVSNLLNNIEESLYISKINNRLKERGMTEDMIIKRLKKEYEVEIKSNGD